MARGRGGARSPFAQQDGVDAARLTLPPGPWPTVAEHLVARLGPVGAEGVARLLAEGRVRGADGAPVDEGTPYRPGGTVWVRRELEPEPVVPLPMPVLHEDDRLVVVDKPPFLASTPRGRHVRETALARARRTTGRPDLVPAHRLDRLTAGVLVLVADRALRGAYQELFARREVTKTYLALAPLRAGLDRSTTVSLHLCKERGDLRARVVAGSPANSETRVEPVAERDGVGLYRLTPVTGRTHQLRVHLAHLGVPILHDPLYGDAGPTPDVPGAPDDRDDRDDRDDLARPLALLAARLALTDPVDGRRLVLTSTRTLPGWSREELREVLDGARQDGVAPAT